MSDERPHVLFVCVHNAGRSQMAAALLERTAGQRIQVSSAGSEPGEHVHAEVVEVMAEMDIDVSEKTPRRLTDEMAKRADVVVTMGCGDACPYIPGKRYIDWELNDPKGLPIDRVREIRDDIGRRVEKLKDELLAPGRAD
jgi:arsenate reductase (thioredoxin)